VSGFETALLSQRKAFEEFDELAAAYNSDPLVSRLLTALQPILISTPGWAKALHWKTLKG
jgi:hypothetical protein